MGCLNSTGSFGHWFGNIHLSGPCNRSCYFCIGQHMMALDGLNTLKTWPLPGLDEFCAECRARGVTEVNVTGTNTDPLLFQHTRELKYHLKANMDLKCFGVRTNGARWNSHAWQWYDKASLTICSLDRAINQHMMGGDPASLLVWTGERDGPKEIKVNIVLGPENARDGDVFRTIEGVSQWGVRRVNLREPYGQPHVGDPCVAAGYEPVGRLYGMPTYDISGVLVTYWDVHYCEVESVNLYASGRVSIDYPITRGHADSGEVLDQSHFAGGRVREQWVTA